MGTKLNSGQFDCLAAALPDEPFFMLLGRDESSPAKVVDWAMTRLEAIRDGKKPPSDIPMIREALNCAVDMVVWRVANRGSVGSGQGAGTLPKWHNRSHGYAEQRAMIKELGVGSRARYLVQHLPDGNETWEDLTNPLTLPEAVKLYNERTGQEPDNTIFSKFDNYRIMPVAVQNPAAGSAAATSLE